MPYLVWKLKENKLSVFSSKEIPDKNTPLFHAPFLNIDDIGSVCMGKSDFISNNNNYEIIIEKVEKAFFTSIFTHTNHNNIIANNNNIVQVYQEQINNVNKGFDHNLLNPINKNLKDICND